VTGHQESTLSAEGRITGRRSRDYGLRHVELRDGVLFYHRDGGREYRLAPMTADTFMLGGLPTFRLRFEPPTTAVRSGSWGSTATAVPTNRRVARAGG
jgi:hypothetical protein